MSRRRTVLAIVRISMLLLWPLATLADDRILMTAKVNGHPLQLAFDTGAGVELIIWRSVADQLQLKVEPAPADFKPARGEATIGLTEPAKVEIFGKTFDGIRLAVFDLPPVASPETQGLVGWPAVRKNRVALKLAENTVRDVEQVPAESEGWLKFSLREKSETLLIELPGKSGRPEVVLVDTGASDGVKLSAEKWREWRAAHPLQPVTLTAYFTPGTGLVVREESWADELTLNQLVLHGVAVMKATASDALAAGPDYAATLGLAALRRVDLVVDGENNAAYLKPRGDQPAPYEHNRLGAVFVPAGQTSDELIAHVAADTPAAAAGIRDGDALLKIDELDVTKWRTEPGILPFSRFWERPAGTKVVLTLRRDKTVRKATVTLKNILGPPSP